MNCSICLSYELVNGLNIWNWVPCEFIHASMPWKVGWQLGERSCIMPGLPTYLMQEINVCTVVYASVVNGLMGWILEIESRVSSSMHPCPEKWVAIGRSVMHYALAPHVFNTGIRCRHCSICSRCEWINGLSSWDWFACEVIHAPRKLGGLPTYLKQELDVWTVVYTVYRVNIAHIK